MVNHCSYDCNSALLSIRSNAVQHDHSFSFVGRGRAPEHPTVTPALPGASLYYSIFCGTRP